MVRHFVKVSSKPYQENLIIVVSIHNAMKLHKNEPLIHFDTKQSTDLFTDDWFSIVGIQLSR